MLDAEGMDQMFSAAFINTRKRQHVVMPWETEFAKKIFKREPVVPAPLTNLSSTWVHWEPPGTIPNLLEPDDQAVFSQVEEGPFYAKALMAISDQTFQEQCAEQTSSAVEKWLSILRLHPTASEVGRLLLEDDHRDQPSWEPGEPLRRCLGLGQGPHPFQERMLFSDL